RLPTDGIVTAEQQAADAYCQRYIAGRRAYDAAAEQEVECTDLDGLRDSIQRFRMHQGLLHRVEFGCEGHADALGQLVVVVPADHEYRVMRHVHEGHCHQRGKTLINAVRARYWFPCMVAKLKEFTRKCDT
ncbi:hypothetical protein IWQ56_007504, partial [Coemansia nantahalensis]